MKAGVNEKLVPVEVSTGGAERVLQSLLMQRLRLRSQIDDDIRKRQSKRETVPPELRERSLLANEDVQIAVWLLKYHHGALPSIAKEYIQHSDYRLINF